MIFDITVNDNDFTHIFRDYFKDYMLDYKYTKIKDSEEFKETYNTLDKARSILFSYKITTSKRKFLADSLKKDLLYWLKDSKYAESYKYISSNITIRVTNTYRTKFENGEHLYVFTKPLRAEFFIIQ